MKILKRKKVATPPSRYKHTGILRTFNFFVLLVSVASLATVFFFLKQNLNAAITEVEGLVELNKQGIVEIIDFSRLEKIVSYMNKKNVSITPVIQDPFNNIGIEVTNKETPLSTNVIIIPEKPIEEEIEPKKNLETKTETDTTQTEITDINNKKDLNIPDSATFDLFL